MPTLRVKRFPTRRFRKMFKRKSRKETRMPIEPDQPTAVDKFGMGNLMVDLPKPVACQNDELTKPTVDPTSAEETFPGDTQAKEAEVEMTSSDEKLMNHLPPEAKKNLVELLQPESLLGNDYRRLADHLGYSMQFITWLGSTREPVMTLLSNIGHMKITDVISYLEEMGRKDAAGDLRKFEESTLSPGEIDEREKMLGECESLQTSYESYDAFVCFANQDEQFFKKLVSRMEAPPYNLRLCYPERDFLGGGCYHENAAIAIEQRCKKFVVLLSKNYDNSDGAVYESQIAITLAPGAEHQRIIPILLEDEYRKTIPKPMAHLTYLDYPRWKGNIPRFWDKLAESLGWIQSQKSCKTVLPPPNACIRATPSRGPSRFIVRIRLRVGKKKKKGTMLQRT